MWNKIWKETYHKDIRICGEEGYFRDTHMDPSSQTNVLNAEERSPHIAASDFADIHSKAFGCVSKIYEILWSLEHVCRFPNGKYVLHFSWVLNARDVAFRRMPEKAPSLEAVKLAQMAGYNVWITDLPLAFSDEAKKLIELVKISDAKKTHVAKSEIEATAKEYVAHEEEKGYDYDIGYPEPKTLDEYLERKLKDMSEDEYEAYWNNINKGG